MKIIKNAIFYLLLGIAVLFTLISFCADGSLWALFGLWAFTILLWAILIIGFRNQLVDYFLHNSAEEVTESAILNETQNQIQNKSTPEDFDECYHIALLCKIKKLLGEEDKSNETPNNENCS